MNYMQQALSLAATALGKVSPNPAVGAVIVKNGVVLGKGCTQPPGSDHAEIVALKQAGDLARGATLFVTLEPCAHFGRTPPCTQAIIAAGIAEVHMAMLDPNPLVAGKGRDELKKANIKTCLGEHEKEARELNEAYIKFITTGKPFISAKFAMSLDGKIATRSGDSKWISNEASREYVQRLRRTTDAVMVGVGTVITDDPRLTVRTGNTTAEAQKLRIVVDSRGRTPPNSMVFSEPGNILIAATDLIDSSMEARYIENGAEILKLPQKNNRVDLEALIDTLGNRNITHILVEGGGTLLGTLFDQKLVDKVIAFIAPVIIGGLQAPTPIAGIGIENMADALRLHGINITTFEQDTLITGYTKGESFVT